MMTRKWTKQDEGFLREHYSNNRTEDLARVLRRSKSAVETHAKRLGIRKSRKFLETYCRFKYKNIPGNSIPEGKESTKGGYIMIKPDGERRLVFKHIWVWEQHNGKRPEGVIITFRDGDKTNCDISNLVMLTKSEFGRFKIQRRTPEQNAEIHRKQRHAISELIRKDKMRIRWGLEPRTKLVKKWYAPQV